MKTGVPGYAGEVEELEFLLQATSVESEEIRLERSWSSGRGSSLAGMEKLVKLKSWTSCCRLPVKEVRISCWREAQTGEKMVQRQRK